MAVTNLQGRLDEWMNRYVKLANFQQKHVMQLTDDEIRGQIRSLLKGLTPKFIPAYSSS
jgi:hypothetical protein